MNVKVANSCSRSSLSSALRRPVTSCLRPPVVYSVFSPLYAPYSTFSSGGDILVRTIRGPTSAIRRGIGLTRTIQPNTCTLRVGNRGIHQGAVMLNRLWKPVIGTAVLVGTPGYLYFKYTSKPKPKATFDLPIRVRGPDGKVSMATRSITFLTTDEVDAKLNEHARALSTVRPGGILWKQTTAFLAANDPIEDANASKIVERDPSAHSPAGDLLFFAVMDGHGGPQTSRLLSKVLIPAVALELALLINEPKSIAPKPSRLEELKSLLRLTKPAPIMSEADPKLTALAIERAFVNLDSEIVDSPLRVLAESMARDGAEKKLIPDLSQHPMAIASMSPAMSGSCALMALFDTAHQNLYVACTGDSRAVAGIWEESEDGKGIWRADVLTEDQTGRNPNELRRMQSEHPPSEANSVIMRGRVLGGLEPTRAFGDARYKWSHDVQAILNKAFLEGNNETMRATPALSKTPPYVTARPVITHRKLNLGHKSKSKLRFVVLATDGLWDQLSSEEVVALVGGHLAGLKGVVPKSDLPRLIPTSSGITVEGKDKRQESDDGGSWAFVDENVSTHLIRNAFGGGEVGRLRQMLSIPPPLARNYRDDITCTVVYWEEGQEEGAATLSSSPVVLQAKAKL